jgi:hypothetical protein
MSTAIAGQLLAAAAWAAAEPGYEVTAPMLRLLAWYVRTGELDLSGLAPPAPDEGQWGGLVARLKVIGIDVWEMCPQRQEAA